MNLALVEPIVKAVLYEGYMLYPYRPSSVKNRQRWTFGGVYPQAYCTAQGGTEAWATQTECLALGDRHHPAGAHLDVVVRFLHLMARDVGELDAPVQELPSDEEPRFRAVVALQVGETLFQTWQEAVERDVSIADIDLNELVAAPQRRSFAFPASRALEPLRDEIGMVVGVIVREQQRLEGAVELAAEHVGEQVFRVTVRTLNLTPGGSFGPAERAVAQMRSFASTHTILGVRGAQFASLLDPPDHLRDAAAGCRNTGSWPVLVGDEGMRDMMLASPIILYDYPQIAPESPGDLFDGTEIDEILTLRIMTMTEDEKREMGAADERARALLQRTELLGSEQLLGLHGAMRGLRPLKEEP